VELIAQKAARGSGRSAVKPLRELGDHPDGGTVGVYDGRYGPYVKWEKVNATLPKEIAPEAITLEQALELIAAKRPAKKARAVSKTAATKKKPAARKPAAKGAAKKPSPNKTAAE
jgi:DNA topoisomerase-1